MKPWQIAAGAAIAIGALVGALVTSPSGFGLIGYIVLGLAGVLTLASGIKPAADDADDSTVELVVVPLAGSPRRWTALEVARWIAMIAGSSCSVIGATWFRFALYEDEWSLTGTTELSSIVTFVAGTGLFIRAYMAGAKPLRTLPKADLWDRSMIWVEDHGAPLALLALTWSSAMMFAGVFNGESIGDDLTFHFAESARLADCIRAGDWDFWNPSANGGYASLYYYQAIPQLASAIPTALFGHHLFWFQLSLWLPLVLVPVCAYRGMRVMGATPWQAAAAALCVTFISGASRWGSGADGTFQVGLYTQTWALAFFPLGLGYGVRYLLEGKNLPSAIGWGTLVFLCHPFASIALCLGLAVGTLAHYLQFRVRKADLRLVLSAVLGLAFVIFIVAVLIDRPEPPPDKPDAPVAPIRYMYLAPIILFGGLLARVALSRTAMSIAFVVGIGIAFVANAILFIITEVVPKRPEGATEDLPAEWQWSAASAYVGPMLLLLAIVIRIVVDLRSNKREDEARPTHWTFTRLCILGACLAVATLPGWITVVVDIDGFGGFPHRVWDEVGPGYKELSRWYSKGEILDRERLWLLTYALPVVVAFSRMKFGRWLWAPALTFAALLALGPHSPKTADDLLPAVRFLGAMQVVLAMAIGAGAFAMFRAIWDAPSTRWPLAYVRNLPLKSYGELVFGVRTVIIAITSALVIFVALQGSQKISSRVSTLAAFDYQNEIYEMNAIIAKQPQGKKQVGPGCENHWWNMLSYVYAKRPSLLQMGGGGLQASPNYDFVFSVREFPKLAWVYDVPLFLFAKGNTNVPDGEVLGETARYELRRLPAPGIVSPIQITGVLSEGKSRAGSKVRNEAIDWLKTDAPLSDHHLAYYGYGGLFQAPDAKVLRAFRVDPSPGELADIYADVEVKQPTTFVARESWHPRWHAYVDGVEVPIRRVTPDFPAIDVQPGKHTLAFRFERPWWAHAAWLAWPGIVLGAWLRRWRKRSALPPARVV